MTPNRSYVTLQGYAPQQQEPPAHAEAVITRSGPSSGKDGSCSGKEGSRSRDSSQTQQGSTLPDRPSPRLHPTRSRRLSHIPTAEVGFWQLCVIECRCWPISSVYKHMRTWLGRNATWQCASVQDSMVPSSRLQNAFSKPGSIWPAQTVAGTAKAAMGVHVRWATAVVAARAASRMHASAALAPLSQCDPCTSFLC